MKVICISLGGFVDYTIQFANELAKYESVMLILPSTVSDEYLQFLSPNVILKLVRVKNKPGFPSNYLYMLMLYDIFCSIKKFNPNIVHVQGAGFSLYAIYILKLIYNFKLISTLHDVNRHLGEEYILHRFIMKFTIKCSDHIFVHGIVLKKLLIEVFNAENSKVSAIPIGEHEVDPFKKYEVPNLKEDGNVCLFFGRIQEYKGLEFLIKAEPLISKEFPNIKIIIAGTGENFEKYYSLMIHPDKFIVYNYRIPYKEGANLFQKSSIVVLPYIEASQSGVIPTAYSFGKPVIVTDVGSLHEIVDDGITGLVVQPKNSKDLAEAIIKLLKDEKLRIKMGVAAYNKLKTDLSWNNIVRTIIAVYRDTV